MTMDSEHFRRTENVPGPFFVDEKCISCAACWNLAPVIFKSHPIETFAFVFHQPANLSETELCLAAQKLCPVAAIHCD